MGTTPCCMSAAPSESAVRVRCMEPTSGSGDDDGDGDEDDDADVDGAPPPPIDAPGSGE